MSNNRQTGPEPPEWRLPPESEDWFRDNPEEDRAGFDAAWRLSREALRQDKSFRPDPDRVRQMETRIAAAIHHESSPPVHLRLIRTSTLWRVAMAAVVLIVAGIFFYSRPVVLTAPAGRVVVVQLPDGSQAELNSGSRLSYSRTYGWSRRDVRLDGEAFFDVRPSSKSFVVHTFNSTVTVLGTRFNVRSWSESQMPVTTVFLEKGKVRLAAGELADEAVILSPGQMSRVSGSVPSAPAAVPVAQELSWRSGGLYFNDAPIGLILDEIERRTGTRITTSPAALRDTRASIVVDHMDSAATVLEMIAEMRGLEFEATETGYVLKRPE